MRVLTVRQPWAWAIIHGGKDFENRSRNIAGAYRGPVAIHAAQQVSPEGAADPVLLAAQQRHRAVFPDVWTRGVIVGVVDLTGVHYASDCWPASLADGRTLGEMCSEWAMTGHYHLELANPIALTTPVPARGRLGLWNPDAALRAALADALLASHPGDTDDH